MAKAYKNGEEFYNNIYLLFNLFIAVSLVPFGYLLLLRQSGQLIPQIPDDWDEIVVVSLLLSAAAMVFQANKAFNIYLTQTKTTDQLRAKLNDYKSASVRKYISFLLSCLICVCGLYLTDHSLFIVGYILTIILLSIKRPTLNTIIDDLHLNFDEQNVLVDKKDID